MKNLTRRRFVQSALLCSAGAALAERRALPTLSFPWTRERALRWQRILSASRSSLLAIAIVTPKSLVWTWRNLHVDPVAVWGAGN